MHTNLKSFYRNEFKKLAFKKAGISPKDKLLQKKVLSLIKSFKTKRYQKILINSKIRYISFKAQIRENKKINILLYSPLEHEVELSFLIKELKKAKLYNIFLPKINTISLVATKLRMPLIKNSLKIKECSSKGRQIDIDIALIPSFGVDKNMQRLGFGKGMYDRYYELLRFKPFSIFISRAKRIAPYFVCDLWDIKADKYVGN